MSRIDEITVRLDRIIELMEAREGLKENVPPKTPYDIYKNNIEINTLHPARARECECDGLVVQGFLVPKLDDVKAYAAAFGIPADVAEDFWNTNSATGWRYKGSMITNWRPLLMAWYRSVKRFETRDAKLLNHIDRRAEKRAAKRTAHIDAKIEEREKKREAKRGSGGGSRKPDNWIEATERERKEFLDGLES